MVKRQKKDLTEKPTSKGFNGDCFEPGQIKAFTGYGICQEQLSPFGGILALIKFLDLIQFEAVLEHVYRKPTRDPKLDIIG